jgi:cytochrome c peroxidase
VALSLLWFLLASPQDLVGEFPRVEVPAENPLTEAKVRLGQALFHEEQLSSDDTMACATCHRLDAGGGDPRPPGRHPGEDQRLNTPDDEFGSLGVVRRDAQGKPIADPIFGFERAVTARNPPTVIGAAFFNLQFWDTRALPTFRNEAGEVVIQSHGSLESQAVGPLMADSEMAHVGRTWSELCAKLARVKPLALASDIPKALAEFLGLNESYAPLFEKAFGSSEITRERIAFALASYERTLVPDQSPFDLGTLSDAQKRGYVLYKKHGACELCHPSVAGTAVFGDGARRNITLPNHERAVKTPTLRNAGLRKRFMSSGQFSTLSEVVQHYENLEFVHFETSADRAALIDFVQNGLTDPRVERREPPFDRPTLKSERPTPDTGTAAPPRGETKPGETREPPPGS